MTDTLPPPPFVRSTAEDDSEHITLDEARAKLATVTSTDADAVECCMVSAFRRAGWTVQRFVFPDGTFDLRFTPPRA